MIQSSPSDNQPFIEPMVAADMFRLTGYQRRRFVDLLLSDRKLSGMKIDGTIPLQIAIKCANIARD